MKNKSSKKLAKETWKMRVAINEAKKLAAKNKLGVRNRSKSGSN